MEPGKRLGLKGGRKPSIFLVPVCFIQSKLFLRNCCVTGTGLGAGEEVDNKQCGRCPHGAHSLVCFNDGPGLEGVLDFKWIPMEGSK